MSTYAIGDIQGCYHALIRLLDKINFDTTNDRLWCVGDIVNRGHQSLQTLDFIMSLGDRAITILGNHELYLLTLLEGIEAPRKQDTLETILSSQNKYTLSTWMRQRPLMHHDKELGFSMVHAGLHPSWEIAQALELATEVSQVLSGDKYYSFLASMLGNEPAYWHDNLDGNDRLRSIVNCCTRMRYINDKHELDFTEKSAPGKQARHLTPWFTTEERKSRKDKIIFGHWSTVHLGEIVDFTAYNVYPIDTGYVWGRQLTAFRLEDETVFSIAANE